MIFCSIGAEWTRGAGRLEHFNYICSSIADKHDAPGNKRRLDVVTLHPRQKFGECMWSSERRLQTRVLAFGARAEQNMASSDQKNVNVARRHIWVYAHMALTE